MDWLGIFNSSSFWAFVAASAVVLAAIELLNKMIKEKQDEKDSR